MSDLKLDTRVLGLFSNSLVTLLLKNDRTLFQSSNFERSGFYSRRPIHLSLHNIHMQDGTSREGSVYLLLVISLHKVP